MRQGWQGGVWVLREAGGGGGAVVGFKFVLGAGLVGCVVGVGVWWVGG